MATLQLQVESGWRQVSGFAAALPVYFLTLERYLLTFAPLTATPYRDGRRIRRSSLRTNVLLRALTVVLSRNSDARSVMLRIPLPSAAHSGAYIPEVARATPIGGFALAKHVKRPRDGRDEGA